nr:hypothetical protein [uncultured Methanospirillum sp.]
MIESIQVTNKSGGSTTSTVCATPTIDYNPITIKVKNDTGNSSISCDWYGITLFGNNNSYAYYRKDAVSVIFLYANDIALLYGMALSTAQTWFEEYVIIKGLRIPSGSKSGVLAYIFFTLLTILGANCITDLNGNSNITILNSVITAIQNATTSQQYQLTINNDTVNFTYDPLNGAIVI